MTFRAVVTGTLGTLGLLVIMFYLGMFMHGDRAEKDLSLESGLTDFGAEK